MIIACHGAALAAQRCTQPHFLRPWRGDHYYHSAPYSRIHCRSNRSPSNYSSSISTLSFCIQAFVPPSGVPEYTPRKMCRHSIATCAVLL